jgi:hypothetical protein
LKYKKYDNTRDWCTSNRTLRQGEWETAQKELYADDAGNIEPEGSPVFEKETKVFACHH